MNAPLLTESFNPAAVQSCLSTLGAELMVDAYGPQACFAAAASIDHVLSGGIAPLPDYGLLHVTGADARSFLHSQVTNDIEHLAPGKVQWNGFCTAKGRLLLSGRNWLSDDSIALLVPRTLAEPLRKRLSMFVLRSKAKVVDASDQFACLGLMGEKAATALARLGLPPSHIDTCTHQGEVTAIRLPTLRLSEGELQRYLLVVPMHDLARVWEILVRADVGQALTPLGSEVWRWTEVRASEPRVVGGAVEQFVPQMVNFDLIGGVNFKKGCYPGQEVVARSHYLGKLKRRMFLADSGPGPCPAPGSDILSPGETEPCGQVVMAAGSPLGGISVLYESQIALAEGATLEDGRALVRLPLPYALPT